jgi:hypothetical protein
MQMKVAHIFATNMAATYKLATMILPQLEDGRHGANVAGMVFFDDNPFLLRAGDPTDKGILLMVCDQCAVRRGLANGTLEQCGKGQVTARGLVLGVAAGCFPQLYAALADNPPDQVITV